MENIVERRIMWGDLDALGIVFYPRYYEWMDASGHLFFDALGLNIGRLWEERNILFGLAETSCRYFRPGRYHQNIRICTRIEALHRKTLILQHDIRNGKDGERMVLGLEKRICMDVSLPGKLKATVIPADLFAILDQARGPQ
jgi:YbgC/YbaW family acyl-CoA thioester hydrolase